jgi:hypothetical protein
VTRLSCLLAVLLSAAACAPVSHFQKGGVSAHGERLEGSERPLWYRIGIDYEREGGGHVPPLSIQLPGADGAEPVESLTPGKAARHLPVWVPPEEWSDIVKARERDRIEAGGYQVYSGSGTYLSFREGRVAFIGLCSHCEGKRSAPAHIGRVGGRLHALPFSEEQMAEVFGVPDRVRRYSQVYY